MIHLRGLKRQKFPVCVVYDKTLLLSQFTCWYLFGHELLSLHVLLLLLLLLFQDLLLMLLFQHRRHLAVQVRRVTVVTRHGVGPRLGRHGVVSGRRRHGVGRARAVRRSGVGVLVLMETKSCSQVINQKASDKTLILLNLTRKILLSSVLLYV